MPEPVRLSRSQPRGCLAAGAGFLALVALAPLAFAIRWWRRWRRGSAIRSDLDVRRNGDRCRVDLTLDVPDVSEPAVRRRATTQVVRIAQALHTAGDTYCAVYRLRSDPEPYLIAVGPDLQNLGDRFLLTLNQGALASRTVVWLALAPDQVLAEVVDPVGCDPEDPQQMERLLHLDAARWTMATSWARIGPSWVVRMVLIVPAAAADEVGRRLRRLR